MAEKKEEREEGATAAQVVKTAERVATIAGERIERKPPPPRRPPRRRRAPRKQPAPYKGPTATLKAIRGQVTMPRSTPLIAELMRRLPKTRITQEHVSNAFKKRAKERQNNGKKKAER